MTKMTKICNFSQFWNKIFNKYILQRALNTDNEANNRLIYAPKYVKRSVIIGNITVYIKLKIIRWYEVLWFNNIAGIIARASCGAKIKKYATGFQAQITFLWEKFSKYVEIMYQKEFVVGFSPILPKVFVSLAFEKYISGIQIPVKSSLSWTYHTRRLRNYEF